jgi:hypothetical protein
MQLFNDYHQNSWFRLLLHLFSIFEQPLTELLKNLIALKPCYFRVIMRNVSFSKSSPNKTYITTELMQICKSLKEVHQMSEFDLAFAWQKGIKKGICKYSESIFAHVKSAKVLTAGSLDVVKEIRDDIGSSFSRIRRTSRRT